VVASVEVEEEPFEVGGAHDLPLMNFYALDYLD